MTILLLLFLFYSIVSPFFIHQQDSNLGFNNQTGSATTQAQVASFISFINSASIFYRDDTKSRLDYISDQMNKTYGAKGFGFSVIQQGDENYFDWTISTYNNIFASVAAGVDKVFPTKSYAFMQEPVSTYGRVYLLKSGQKGRAIDPNLQTVIKNAINSVETSSICSCSGSSRYIAGKLHDFDQGNWNVFCSNTTSTFCLNMYPLGGYYIYAQPKNCFYGIYRI